MIRPDIQVEYDHENRCVWADNRKYVLKRTDVHREHYDMTFEWESKKLILEIGRGVSKGWHGRKPSNNGRNLKYDDGQFENPAHKFKSWEETEQLFGILFLCLEKFLIDFPRDMTGFDFDAHWNRTGFAMYRFEDVVVKEILHDRPNFVWPDPE
ncbi:MAG: hypothetical protein ABJG15_04830 [Hyphomonadaceae bacterium]